MDERARRAPRALPVRAGLAPTPGTMRVPAGPRVTPPPATPPARPPPGRAPGRLPSKLRIPAASRKESSVTLKLKLFLFLVSL